MAVVTLPQSEDLAQELFEIFTRISLSTQSAGRRGLELKEIEFLTLALLQNHETMIVGEIQRQLGVLPAQMSRIIRSLENRQPPLIACQINTEDKRKIDVRLTEAGRRALLEYQEVRIQKLSDVLKAFPEEDREDLVRIIDVLNRMFENGAV